jgi:integrase
MAEHHEMMGGKVHVYKRENSTNWQASTYLHGKNWRVSTKQDSLAHAMDFAEDWYLGLRGKARNDELKVGKKFREAAKHFLAEYLILIQGERNPNYVKAYDWKLRVHLLPFFGDKVLSEITPGLVQQYRVHRTQQNTQMGKPPSRSTLHQEIVVLRQVLKAANRQGWLAYVPDLSPPYKASGKISHRAWFSPDEYKALYEATRQRARQPLNNRHRWACEQLHDYVLFVANTGLRPDEAARLEFRDVKIVKDHATKQTILEIEVRGKRGIGWCKSTPNAVYPFQQLQARERRHRTTENGKTKTVMARPGPTDRLFLTSPRELLNTILGELQLKVDRDGNPRTAYSLRHTYICFRLMEGADIYQIAKNCRTSVEMIEKFYASHIKTMLDASAINVMKGTIRRDRKDREGGRQNTLRTGRKNREGGPKNQPPKGAKKPLKTGA